MRVKQPGSMLFVSGQIPIEVPAGTVFLGPMKRQADLAFTHMKNVVMDAGFTMDEIDRYAKICRVERVIRPYLEALVA